MAPSTPRSRPRASLNSEQPLIKKEAIPTPEARATKRRKLAASASNPPTTDEYQWFNDLSDPLKSRTRAIFELSAPVTLNEAEYNQIWPNFSKVYTPEEASTPSAKRKSMQAALRYQCRVSPQSLRALRQAIGASSDCPGLISVTKTGRAKQVRYEFSRLDGGAAAIHNGTAARVKKESTVVKNEAAVETTPAKRKRKTQAEKDAETEPLAARTKDQKLYIGAHVSSAGGVQNSVPNSLHIGANAFALFLKSQRKWSNPPLAPSACTAFHEACTALSYNQAKHVVPHGSYLVNLAHTDAARTEQAYASFLDDLQRCEALGITLYNFHPGNSVGGDRGVAIAHLANNLNRAHKETKGVVTLLENMAAGGNVLGSTFEDLRDIIALVEDKSRVGVCIDTCHAFAGGYDLRTPETFKHTMDEFGRIVGFEYLRAMHLNDSKAPFASYRDVHANIGTGFLGLRGFHCVVNEPRFEGLPLVLETPLTVRDENGLVVKDDKGKEKEDKGIWAREIKLLESLVGMDTESDEFLELEKGLSRQGQPERARLLEQHEKRMAKGGAAKTKKGKRKADTSDEDDDEDE